MNKSLSSWLPWVVLAVVVVAALLFVDFDRFFSDKNLGNQIENLSLDTEIDDLDDDAEFDIDDTEDEAFID